MSKQCACKGIRRCLLCEDILNSIPLQKENENEKSELTSDIWYYCMLCGNKAYRENVSHDYHLDSSEFILINGVYVETNFISEEEENLLCQGIDQIPWVDSQSGRRKQDFGPKVNFKKKKIRIDTFQGFPAFSRFIIDRMKSVDKLADFLAVEMCNLEYVPSRGSAIDPHFDDFWLWGERLVTVNLLSHTCYTLSQKDSNVKVLVSLPRRCLCVLAADARYKWMHAIERHHVTSRRLGINIRELTEEFLENGSSWPVGNELLDKAKINFPTNSK